MPYAQNNSKRRFCMKFLDPVDYEAETNCLDFEHPLPRGGLHRLIRVLISLCTFMPFDLDQPNFSVIIHLVEKKDSTEFTSASGTGHQKDCHVGLLCHFQRYAL